MYTWFHNSHLIHFSQFSHYPRQVPRSLPHHTLSLQIPRPSLTGQTLPSTSQASGPDLRSAWADSSPCPEFFNQTRVPTVFWQVPDLYLEHRRRHLLVRPPCLPVRSLDSLASISSRVHPVQISVFSVCPISFSSKERLSLLFLDYHQVSGLIPPPEVSILSNQSDSPVVAALKWCHHWGVI